MKILVYSNCPLDPALGSGKTRVRFSEGLRARGHSVRVIEPDAVRLWPHLRAGHRFRLALGARWHLQRTLARESFDLVEINGGEFGWLASWLHGRRQRPLLVHRTDGCELLATAAGETAGATAPLHRALDRAAFTHIDACAALCGADRAHLVRGGFLPASRVAVVPPGLDDEFLAASAPTARPSRLAFLGSWIERKGVDTLVAAVTPLLERHPETELELIGTSRGEEELRALFPTPLRPRLHVPGRISREELAQRLTRASIFVLPARYEGFGMATAEAMACGCAAVTTPTGFGADLRDQENALVVPIGDAPALRRALEHLITDAALRHRIALAGWRTVQEFRWERAVAQLETAYLGWLAQR